MNYYRIHFAPYDSDYYLSWGHGEFHITRFPRMACVLTDEYIKYQELIDYLKFINKEYRIEECEQSTVKSIRIYE